ncbi:hypothetical protein P43SY_006470 [Pythium insidiosum]|uniref:Cation/H+ exchanger transmembrane domain-containing protein n=1 Tax=Pythium insidiosum TaxID=114742 RepID=A0AAD5Q4D9_PYTIN|nr:hypothetical protein P43SY_006470 [Pythium insidiosum]
MTIITARRWVSLLALALALAAAAAAVAEQDHAMDPYAHSRGSGALTQSPLEAARGVERVVNEATGEEVPVEISNVWTSVELFTIASLQLILVMVAYRLDRTTNPVLISESVVAMFFGVMLGAVMRFISPMQSVKHAMDPEVLFYALLPPIILEAGFSMKKRGFFANFSTILLLAGLGTLIAMFVVGGILIWLGNLGIITKLTAAEAYLYAIVAFTLFQRLIKAGITDVTLHDTSIVVGKVFGIVVSLPPGSSGGVSDEMRSLLDGYKKLHETILKVQSQIEEEETAYLEDTAHGNIVRGWDGFIDSKQSRKDATLKKVKPYTEAEHLFSSCCHYRSLAKEPTQELVEFIPREESTSGLGRPPKIKKRKRLEVASTASATHSETGEDDDKEPVVKKKREGEDDFLDML